MKAREVTPAPDFAPLEGTAAQAQGESANPAARGWFRKKRFVLPPALILVLIIIVAASGGFGGTPDTAKSPAQPTESRAVAAGIGTMLRDGRFEFVVTGVERPGKSLAGKYGETLTAQGEFVVVRVNVTNMGTDTRPPNCSCQLLFNDKGQKFKPSSAILSTKEALKFVQRITPGDTVVGVLMLFDVPPGTRVTMIELHDTPLSQGVNVKLS